MQKVKIGKIVAITCLDHVQDAREVSEVVVYGRLTEITDICHVIEFWTADDPEENRDYRDEDTGQVAIVSAAITKIRVLEEA